MDKKGFTLIELAVVVALLGILAIVFAPRLRENIAKAKDAKIISLLGAMRGSSEAYYSGKGELPFGTTPIGVNNYNSVNASDKPGLDIVISSLNQEAKRMFTSSYTIDIGGTRESESGDISYGGEIGFTFHAPAGSVADGISLWFIERAIGTTASRYDTKGVRWTSY